VKSILEYVAIDPNLEIQENKGTGSAGRQDRTRKGESGKVQRPTGLRIWGETPHAVNCLHWDGWHIGGMTSPKARIRRPIASWAKSMAPIYSAWRSNPLNTTPSTPGAPPFLFHRTAREVVLGPEPHGLEGFRLPDCTSNLQPGAGVSSFQKSHRLSRIKSAEGLFLCAGANRRQRNLANDESRRGERSSCLSASLEGRRQVGHEGADDA